MQRKMSVWFCGLLAAGLLLTGCGGDEPAQTSPLPTLPLQSEEPSQTPGDEARVTATPRPTQTATARPTATATPKQTAKPTATPKATKKPKTLADYNIPTFSKDEDTRFMQKSKYYERIPSGLYRDISYYWEELQGVRDVGDRYYFVLDSDKRYYTHDELSRYSKNVLWIARNEMFARHGRVFDNKDLYNYFMAMMWYEPKYTPEEYDAKYSTRVFNEYEKANYKLIRQVEKEKGYR